MSNVRTFEEELEERGYLVYTNVGCSMMPLLRQGRDLMEIHKKGEGRCRKYDAVLYKRGSSYILHRILKVRKDDYLIVGDNCYYKEYVKEEQILGILKAVVRDGKKIDVETDKKYRLYVHLWCDFFPIRALILRVRPFAHRVKSLIKRAGKKVLALIGLSKKKDLPEKKEK